MTKNEALKMAIEALSQDEGWFEPEKAIKACKEALEQSKQFLGMKEIPYKDWVLRFYKMPNDLWYTEGINEEWMNEMFEASKPQPAQEPVAWIKALEIAYIQSYKEDERVTSRGWRTNLGLKPEPDDVPLYTHPAPSWQGLSDDEIVKELERLDEYTGKSFFAGVRWAEQALKEKNT